MKVNKRSIKFSTLAISIKFSTLAISIILLVLFLSYNEVDNSITEEDKVFITKYLENISPLKSNRRYKEELEFITKTQSSVLKVAPYNEGIPFNAEREPKDVYLASKGLWHGKFYPHLYFYDTRSRVIEKILAFSGFDTRHISIYSTKNTNSPFRSLSTPNISSHAITEVLTQRGWLVVDSNDQWLSIDTQGNPVSIAKIKLSAEGSGEISWRQKAPNKIYKEPFVFIYGLYSRHGKFYPPYTFVPDVNYKELIQNFL